jgi:O-antigen/teichoic acid export membrane protein
MFIAALAAIPITLVNRLCGQVLRNQFRPVPFTVLNIGSIGLAVALSVAAVALFELGILGIFVGTFVAEVAMLPVRIWVVRDLLRPAFSLGDLKQLLAYGAPLVPMSLAYWIFLTSDRIVLAQLSTLDQVGLYSVAVTLVAVPSVAIAAVGQAWSPHAIAAYEANEDEARWLVSRMGTYLLAGFGLLAVAITTFAAEILAILTTAPFADAAAAVPPLALAMVAQATTNVTALGISLKKRTVYLAALAWLAAGINLGLNVLLDGPFGMLGAAWATAVSYVALSVGYLFVSQRLWPVPFDRRAILIGAAATVAFTIGAGAIPSLETIPAMLLKCAYGAAFVTVLLASGVVDRRMAAAAIRALRPASR